MRMGRSRSGLGGSVWRFGGVRAGDGSGVGVRGDVGVDDWYGYVGGWL